MLIGDFLPDKDLAHLAQGNHYFNEIFARSLLCRALEEQPPPVVKIHALLWAIHHGHTSLVKTIVSQPMFSMYTSGVYEALNLASELGHPDMIPLLIAAGYEVGGYGSKSPLHIAASNGHASVVTQLLDHGAQIHKKDGQDRTAFACALEAPWIIWKKLAPKGISNKDNLQLMNFIEAQVTATITILLHRGAHSELSTTDRDGYTPLHLAVLNCLEPALDFRVGTGTFRLLVQAGVPLNARDNIHLTAFELAVTSSTPTAVAFFLDIGLSPNTKDFYGNSLLSNSIRCDKESFQVMELLLQTGANADEVNLWDFFYDSDDEDPVLFDKILTLFLIHGASFGSHTSASECFSYAAMRGMLEVMKVVLERCPGIDINTKVHQNSGSRVGTPLQLAISSNRADILEYLLEHGVKMSTMEEKQVAKILG